MTSYSLPKKTPNELKKFEEKVATFFNSGKIPHPVHLSDGNEDSLIEIFKFIKSEDWIFGSWRSHYHCLLKGVPEQELESAILEGKSIALNFPEYKVFSSAIVGGILPISVGVALSLKRNGSDEHVWCFLGDMTSETGMAQTCIAYSRNMGLPITFVVEDNGLSVLTDTRKTWGVEKLRYEIIQAPNVLSYKYKNSYPHAGAGVRVQF